MLCLHDVNIDLFLWVLVRKKRLIAFEEFLCLVCGGVTRDEVLTFQSKAVSLNFVERS